MTMTLLEESGEVMGLIGDAILPSAIFDVASEKRKWKAFEGVGLMYIKYR